MVSPAENIKPAFLRRLESLLLAVCLCVIALRCTYLESIFGPTTNTNALLTNMAFSLLISSVLIFAAGLWVFTTLCRKIPQYRPSGIGFGLAVFSTASILAIMFATNKSASIISAATLIAPMLMAILLIQIIDSPAKLRILLWVIIALAVAATHQCFDQRFSSNQAMVDDYQQNQQQHLEVIGITPNTLQHFQYEHRLYSKDIRGFLTTSNSTGSFFLLALFASVALLGDKAVRVSDKSALPQLLCYCLMTAIIAAGLFATRSKGAISAGIIGVCMFGLYLVAGRFLRRYRTVILIICIALGVVVLVVVIHYGITNGRLPGGNSMLVRWQYWLGGFDMFKDHPFFGAGPACFADYYIHYKIPAAPETVSDPHNFILSLLCRFGPLGLLGFLAAVFLPLWETIYSDRNTNQAIRKSQPGIPTSLMTLVAVFLLITLLIIRPFIMADYLGANAIEVLSVALILYIAPTGIFLLAGWLLWACEKSSPLVSAPFFRVSSAALFCGIASVLIHNLIDFAIFEPGVLTIFWAVVAAMVLINRQHQNVPFGRVTFVRISRIAAIAALLIAVSLFLHFSFVPVMKAAVRIQLSSRRPSRAHIFLAEAAAIDKYDPRPSSLNGRLSLRRYQDGPGKNDALLLQAADYFDQAVERNSADYKNFEKLSKVYDLLAATEGPESVRWQQKALDAIEESVSRYPGSARLRIELAGIAERLGKKEMAIENYQLAIKIEDSYSEQFKIMYPDFPVFSRLGKEKYSLAKDRLAAIDNSSPQSD
jgi:tetratricopeptide (TPR) repeat protein